MIENQKIEETTFIPKWNAVYAAALGVAGLITSEFLPVSLLTPMANDLNVTEGIAGQAISVTAIMAMVTSLLITVVTKSLDRRWVLLTFCLLQIISNLFVAFAPNFAILLVGRVLLGIGIGGFWAMAAATAMRLVPKKMVPKALSIIFGAVSLATVVAAPLGSFLGTYIGWRNVFLISAVIGVVALIWQAITLPSMPTDKVTKLSDLLSVLKRPTIKAGMLATLFVFMGYATFFTYLRPFLETVTGVNVTMLSTILLGFGIANLIGTTLARYLLEWNIYKSLFLAPLIMGIVVAALVLLGEFTIITSVLIAIWGMVFGLVQVGWTAWLTRTIPDAAEAGGGLQVATVQLAITLGAAIGGFFFDFTGVKGVFISSSFFTLTAALIAVFAFKNKITFKINTMKTKTIIALIMLSIVGQSCNKAKEKEQNNEKSEVKQIVKTNTMDEISAKEYTTFTVSDDVTMYSVTFKNQYKMTVAGHLFIPNKLDQSKQNPAIIVGHPMGAVKEQSADIYASNMADRGFITLAIDLSFWGESEGEPRNAVLPDMYAEDFSAAVDFLGTRPFVDRNNIGIIGVCGSGSFVISAAKIDPRMKAIATVSMYDMGSVNRNGLNHSQNLDQRKQIIDDAAEQRYLEFNGGETKYTGGTVLTLDKNTHPIQREFFDFYRTPRGEYTPKDASKETTTKPTLSSNTKFMNFYPFNDIETISPRPLLFITGDQAHSKEFSEEAYKRAAEPKELFYIKGAGHVDLYDKTDLIPFEKLEAFFKNNLK